jgi:hypothetical protein
MVGSADFGSLCIPWVDIVVVSWNLCTIVSCASRGKKWYVDNRLKLTFQRTQTSSWGSSRNHVYCQAVVGGCVVRTVAVRHRS